MSMDVEKKIVEGICKALWEVERQISVKQSSSFDADVVEKSHSRVMEALHPGLLDAAIELYHRSWNSRIADSEGNRRYSNRLIA